jgi:hypothetical protein
MAFENRRYLIIPASVVDQVDFNQVHETSADTCRYSVDGTKTFVKYEVNILTEDHVETHFDAETNEEVTTTIPAGTYGRPSVWDASYPEHTHAEILEILATEEWTAPLEEGMM